MKTQHFFTTAALLLILLFVAPCALKAQVPDGTKMVVMRSYESPSPMFTSQIVISYGNGKSETIEMEVDNKKNAPENLDKINKVLTRIEDQGFELVTSHAILVYGANATTYIFRKVKD